MMGYGEKVAAVSGDVYKGEFLDNKEHGKGRLEFASGGWYEGMFLNGRMHGRGKREYASVGHYEGDFHENN